MFREKKSYLPLDLECTGCRQLRADLAELQTELPAWELRMEDVHEKCVYALRRMGKREQDQQRSDAELDPTEDNDPITEAVLARRRVHSGVPTESSR